MLKKIIIGITAGIISGLFSTGGGMILVPAFIYILKINEKTARATSIACVFAMVLTTSVIYLKNKYLNFEAFYKNEIIKLLSNSFNRDKYLYFLILTCL